MSVTAYKTTYISEKKKVYDFTGKSTDDKPVFNKEELDADSSTFYEVDTKKFYFYDSDSDEWVEHGGAADD